MYYLGLSFNYPGIRFFKVSPRAQHVRIQCFCLGLECSSTPLDRVIFDYRRAPERQEETCAREGRKCSY